MSTYYPSAISNYGNISVAANSVLSTTALYTAPTNGNNGQGVVDSVLLLIISNSGAAPIEFTITKSVATDNALTQLWSGILDPAAVSADTSVIHIPLQLTQNDALYISGPSLAYARSINWRLSGYIA